MEFVLGTLIRLGIAFVVLALIAAVVHAEPRQDTAEQSIWEVCDERYDPRLEVYRDCKELLEKKTKKDLELWKLRLEVKR